jgi:hypothetical protein
MFNEVSFVSLRFINPWLYLYYLNPSTSGESSTSGIEYHVTVRVFRISDMSANVERRNNL